MKRFRLSIILFISTFSASAQLETVSIFKQTISKIEALKSVSYIVKSVNRNPFSKDDISLGETTASIAFNNGLITYKKETDYDAGLSKTSEIFYGGKLISVNFIDSTYTSKTPKEVVDCDLTTFATNLHEAITKNAKKIFRKPDTLFEGKNCYSFLVKNYDTIVNGQRDFTHKLFLIGKKDLLPVYFRATAEGSTSKGGYALGRLKFYNDKIFSAIKLNPKIVANPFNVKGFSLPNTAMLEKGEVAPHLKVIKLSGEKVDEGYPSNKVFLVVFGSIGCPANPLANPVLNRLQTKYIDKKVSILNIFTGETSEQVRKYMEANQLKFPVYLADRKLHKDFKILGTPNFYVIGTDGKIKTAIDGYSDKLEDNLVKTIDEQLSKF